MNKVDESLIGDIKPLQIVFYTVILGGYDYLSPFPLKQNQIKELVARPVRSVNMILVSDQRWFIKRGWEPRAYHFMREYDSAVEANRYAKFFPHKIFPDADVSIYVDGNVVLGKGLVEKLNEFLESNAALGLSSAPERTSIEEELEACKRDTRFTGEELAALEQQVFEYRQEGLPDGEGLYAGRVLFRDHRHNRLAGAMDDWWKEFKKNSRRDQIALPAVIWRHNLPLKVWYWNHKTQNDLFYRVIGHKPKYSLLRPDRFLETLVMKSGFWRAVEGLCRRLRARTAGAARGLARAGRKTTLR